MLFKQACYPCAQNTQNTHSTHKKQNDAYTQKNLRIISLVELTNNRVFESGSLYPEKN